MDKQRSVSQAYLLEILDYDSETGIFRWAKSRPHIKSGDIAGTIHKEGYVRIQLFKRCYAAHRLAWLYSYGDWPVGVIDHINGKTADNRLSNLRECSITQNQYNSKLSSANKSGVKGVYWSKSTKKWQASIRVGGQLKHLGTFDDIQDAARARKYAAIKFHGEYVNHG